MKAEAVVAPTEMELLHNVLEVGDEAAWREFYQRFDSYIYRCITCITARFSGMDREDVAEIRGNVNLRLLDNNMRKLRDYDPERGMKLKSWIGMMANQTTYDYLRRVSRQPLCTDQIGFLTDGGCDAFDLTAAREELRLIERALAGFSERDQVFIRLLQIEERPADEVAELMGISTKTVYTKMYKIRAKLADLGVEL
jgi:RNA polymerase sigma-70 factor (ECF subfamily)